MDEKQYESINDPPPTYAKDNIENIELNIINRHDTRIRIKKVNI